MLSKRAITRASGYVLGLGWIDNSLAEYLCSAEVKPALGSESCRSAMLQVLEDCNLWKDFPKGLHVLVVDKDPATLNDIKAKLEACRYRGKRNFHFIYGF